jgi:hypothetical protein
VGTNHRYNHDIGEVMKMMREFHIGNAKVRFRLDTFKHMWLVYRDNEESPILKFTKAKGLAVIRFLDTLLKEK